MFRKLVSNLSFAPSAVSQLTFYLRRLQKENLTRKLSAVAGGGLLLLQVAAIVAPPTASNAASTNDIIYGGLNSAGPKKHLLEVYDQDKDSAGHTGFQKMFTHFGITRNNLANAELSTINSNDHSFRSLGRNPHSNLDERVDIGGQTYYLRPLYTWGEGVSYQVLKGQRADGSFFAVLVNCGNIVIRKEASLKCISLKANDGTGTAPFEVTFTGRAEAEGQKITDWIFNFGDGEKKEHKDHKITHKYEKPGKYTATLRVRSNTGKTTEIKDACSVNINVKEKLVKELDCISLKANKTKGQFPFKVTFTAKGEAQNQTISEYRFDYGDGEKQNSKDNKATHTYQKAGSYTATVAVVGSKSGKAETGVDCQVPITVTTEAAPEEEQPIEGLELAKTARNVSLVGSDGQHPDANGTTANPGETIQYTLTTKNTGSDTLNDYEIREDISDILEYADLVDAGGGSLLDGDILAWPKVDIEAGQNVVKTFKVTIKNPLPATPISVSDPESFDLCMDNVYGPDRIRICLPPPTPGKGVEVAAANLPQTGLGTNLAVVGVTVALVVFFYLRNRQLMTEIRILRGENN